MKKIILTCVVFLLATQVLYAEDYARERFEHWSDIDNDKLDARHEALYKQAIRAIPLVLIDDSEELHYVVSGFWVCPYTGVIFTDPTKMDVDHIVPLKWAWEHGASEWDETKRKEFANDQDNLIAVDAGSNRSKGAKGPNEWMPPNIYFGLKYLYLFINVCEKYELVYPKKEFADIAKQVKIHRKGIKLNKLN